VDHPSNHFPNLDLDLDVVLVVEGARRAWCELNHEDAKSAKKAQPRLGFAYFASSRFRLLHPWAVDCGVDAPKLRSPR